MVERGTVNADVEGSIPSVSAKFRIVKPMREAIIVGAIIGLAVSVYWIIQVIG